MKFITKTMYKFNNKRLNKIFEFLKKKYPHITNWIKIATNQRLTPHVLIDLPGSIDEKKTIDANIVNPKKKKNLEFICI